MNFPDENISKYAEAHTSDETPALQSLNRETHAKVLLPQMLSGKLQGRVLSMLSRMIKPRRILEIGTYTGYSAICLSEGLSADGIIHTIDINEELNDMILKYFKEAGVDQKIKLHIGDAAQIIPSLKETFDLVFIDADKINYAKYYDLAFDKVRTGGFIIADNVLWSGKILGEPGKMDEDTLAIYNYSKKVAADPRVSQVLLPVRDGLLIAQKN